MASGCKRCSLHGIDYPLNYNMCLVPDCQERNLSYISNGTPDPAFKDMVAHYSHLNDDNEVEGFPHSIKTGPRVIHESVKHLGDAGIPDCLATIHHHADKRWIAHEDLIKATYTHLEDFQIVMIHGKFYELQAHVGRAYLTHGLRGGAWWIEEIDIDAECEDIRALPTAEEVNN